MIYDSDHSRVPLEKEIRMIKDYLVLEKVRMGNRLELDIAVKGEISGAMITPLLLFSFVENCVSYISNKNLETGWMNLEFQIARGELVMKIIHGKTNEPLPEATNENAIAGIRKRLDFFYPGKYELKTTVEPEVIMINLKIVLQDEPGKLTNNGQMEERFAYVTA
jgi:LytS/YehU family sensor histidine kinase